MQVSQFWDHEGSGEGEEREDRMGRNTPDFSFPLNSCSCLSLAESNRAGVARSRAEFPSFQKEQREQEKDREQTKTDQQRIFKRAYFHLSLGIVISYPRELLQNQY